ncbi:hypothetical protein D3C87_1397570 [compost metagenome]
MEYAAVILQQTCQTFGLNHVIDRIARRKQIQKFNPFICERVYVRKFSKLIERLNPKAVVANLEFNPSYDGFII